MEGSPVTIPMSVLDLARIRPGGTVGQALADTVDLARTAEEWGYRRVWYAEHHNLPTIASAAPAVIIAHVAAHTERIRLGSGGVMLPNHSPLVVAEQFGTLAELHPGRIDLGLGRAPGTDQTTMRALRRGPDSAAGFPEDVRELQSLLSDRSSIPGVSAIPGRGTEVPLYILGSSLFGARLAAHHGLPYAFASHFAPDALEEATALYLREFRPGPQADRPYLIAAVNVVAHDDPAVAARMHERHRRRWVEAMVGRGRRFSDDELDMILDSAAGRQVLGMIRHTAVGDGPTVAERLDEFAGRLGAAEIMVVPAGETAAEARNTLEVIARACRADAA